MIKNVLPAALAVAIFLGAGGYTFRMLDDKSFMIAEVSRDVCLRSPTSGPASATRCARPMRDYEAGRIWRYVFAASVGATFALLLVGGVLIVIRGRHGEDEVPPGRSGS